MSQGIVEIARRVTDAFIRGDFNGAYKDAAPDFVFDNSRAVGEWRGVHTGLDQFRRMWETFAEPWESIHWELEEMIDAGDRVLSSSTTTFLGRDGIEVTARGHWVWTFRGDSKVTRVDWFEDRAEALEAAGLSE